jgi:hypothetical protein
MGEPDKFKVVLALEIFLIEKISVVEDPHNTTLNNGDFTNTEIIDFVCSFYRGSVLEIGCSYNLTTEI